MEIIENCALYARCAHTHLAILLINTLRNMQKQSNIMFFLPLTFWFLLCFSSLQLSFIGFSYA